MLEVTSVTASLRVVVDDRWITTPPPEVQAQVDRIWHEEKVRWGDRIFDDKIFSVRSWSDSEIFGNFVDYRLFFAQHKCPELFAALNIRPLAVSGVVQTDDGIVFGQRNESTTQDPGLWELVPSGGIGEETRRSGGAIVYEDQLLAEIQEELGISTVAVSKPWPFILVHDTVSHAIDIGLFLRAAVGGTEVRRAFQATGSHEYDRLHLVEAAELDGFLADVGPRIVPVSLSLLAAARPLLGRQG